jgi:glycosyltransferase involved in cell wall biosynthesis
MSFSVVIPFRGDCDDRVGNLNATIRYWQQYFPAVEVIVVEQASTSSLGVPPGVRLILQTKEADGPFSRARTINAGVLAATGDTIVVSDADLVLLPPLMQDCLDKAGSVAVVKPYMNIAWCTAEASKLFRTHFDFKFINPAVNAPIKMQNVPNASGGMFIIRRNQFLHIGGFDERFVGWGKEDEATDIKIHRFMQVHVMPNIAAHLYHPDGPRALWQANNRIYLEVKRLGNRSRDDVFLADCRAHGVQHNEGML